MASYFTSEMNPTPLHSRDVNAMVDWNLATFKQVSQAFANFMGDEKSSPLDTSMPSISDLHSNDANGIKPYAIGT